MSVGRFIQIIEMMNSSNIDVNVLRVIKRNLERGEKYIQAFMSIEGSLHMLKEFLIGPDVEKLLEAIGCCTNLCFSSHEVTVKVINKIAPYLITFLNGSNIIVQSEMLRAQVKEVDKNTLQHALNRVRKRGILN
ncbi:uncharacterized protein LOC111631051 isoform X2 [Centruroides sculpturatus]|uniref:uncharacterized protein LOC111631051 isoform X2 n=1 Tax=Centruroides sculpturatus TaxID=218467 RepID=UPI000C6E4FBB|nr:uncharacterized protein LOC111631051 isoform X2 [Centruroides sculpturatus]